MVWCVHFPLVFPIEPKKGDGPPWYVCPEHYDVPLAGKFEKVLDKVPEKQHLLVWKRISNNSIRFSLKYVNP